MQARYYDPNAGRFLSVDPMTMMDMGMSPEYFNRYSYTANDPINATDPTGMCTGSRITDDAGNCASTGGSNTGLSGVAQGMANDRAFSNYIQGNSSTQSAQVSQGVGSSTTGVKPKKIDPRQLLLEAAVGAVLTDLDSKFRIPVYRVCDNVFSCKTGTYWTPNLPNVSTWRNDLAVYPSWNRGTMLNVGHVSGFSVMGRNGILPSGNPGSIAGPQPYSKLLGGGPYTGTGIEWRIMNPSVTVKDQKIIPFDVP